MSATGWALAGAAWAALSLALAVAVGRLLRGADERERQHMPDVHNLTGGTR